MSSELMLKGIRETFADSSLTLDFDTSMLWNEFCPVKISVIWSGRSLTVAQTALKHPSASVAFKDYHFVLKQAYAQIPLGYTVTFLANRGFNPQPLLQWLDAHKGG